MGISFNVTSNKLVGSFNPAVSPDIRRHYCSSYRISTVWEPDSHNLSAMRTLPKITKRNISIYSLKATADHLGEAGENGPPQAVQKPLNIFTLVSRFVRPYILHGTLLGFAGIVGRTWMENYHLVIESNWMVLSFKTLVALFTVLGIDGYVGPINQIFDLKIDKINKPYLPLASGEIPMHVAWGFALGSAIHSIGSAIFLKSKAFLLFVLLELAAGSIYSIPPFYTKKSTYGAVLTCASMRGYIFHLLLCAAATTTLGLPFKLSPPVIFIAIFTTVFGLAIGVLKDLPDVEGDRLNNVPTLASIYGPKLAANIGFGFMFLCYAGSAAAALLFPAIFKSHVMIPAHLAIGCCVAYQAWKLSKENYTKEASKSFYKFMWNLLNVEYLLFPFI